MAELPTEFPPMGAEFEKPYMEFEYQGKIHRVDKPQGGHNGYAAAACKSSPPEFDPEKGRWVVKLTNNLIDIDLSKQPQVAMAAFPEAKAFLRKTHIYSNPRKSFQSIGYLLSHTTSPNERPSFPVDCIFYMHIRIALPGKPSLVNVKPFELIAKDLTTWPPPVGTVYDHEDTVEMYPEWVPFSEHLMKPIVRILPGDKTMLTRVFEVNSTQPPASNTWRTLVNHLT